jgi:heme/copper-type cytochrome/quinol oxidase subunit 2
VKVTAGQWFWRFEDGGTGDNNTNPLSLNISRTRDNVVNTQSISSDNSPGQVRIKAGETVKFVAHSIDVNHGFGVLSSSNQMDSPLMQMQVVPGFDNVFYYTFNKPGTYTVRCLEYCGWNHPYMVSLITVETA